MALQRGNPDPDDTRFLRAIAFTFIGATAILALYFGREVLLPAAVAILLAFILSPTVTRIRRVLPQSLAVTTVVLLAVTAAALLTVFVMAQLAEVAGSLTSYQANLQHKIQDIRNLSESGGPLSRFMAMVASLTNDFAAHNGEAAGPVMRVQSGDSSFATIAAFVLPFLHPLLTIGIIVILVVFILLDRDHISDQVVRLFGGSNVHATSEALEDAAGRVARVLSLQLLTNFGFSLVVGGGLFLFGTPNAILWGLLAGALRFVPYVGAALGAVLPTVIAFAVSPGWIQPFFVLGWIVGCDIFLGQIIEPLIFGDSTGVTPLALILSALFWGTLWGPVGLLLSTPITICLLVLGRHVPNLGFLQVLLGDEPALAPYQQIYRRLIRRAVTEASTVAFTEIEEKGRELGLDDSMGRMVVLAEADRATDRLSADQIDAIVEGTDLVLDFLDDAPDEQLAGSPSLLDGGSAASQQDRTFVRCVGGRGQIDDAAASIIAFALRQGGINATSRRHGDRAPETDAPSLTIHLICYASHPSEAVQRYTLRKLRGGRTDSARHAILDYDAAVAGTRDALVGNIAEICRLTAQLVATVSKLEHVHG
jgi:predicted PurR-regulated permease PerM